MDSKESANEINNFPGFIASVPTAGHVQIRSIFFVGHITYYPAKGTVDISNGVFNSGLKNQLDRMKEEKGISVYVLMCKILGQDATDKALSDQNEVKFLNNVMV